MYNMSNQRPLLLYNSLTKKKDPFIPINGRRVKWYNCGPTVYDHSHMGHARSYMTFDIIRRILQDYFGYEVLFVQNVTDIDDKIIKRARQRFLFQEYQMAVQDGVFSIDVVKSDVQEGTEILRKEIERETNVDKKSMLEKTLLAVTQLPNDLSSSELVARSKDVLVLLLDHRKAKDITDNAVFSALPKEFEEEFNRDMESLNVMRPTAVTRVSEYVPEIVEYITKVIKNGYAYESNGSVYFDVDKFNSQPQHRYAKLDQSRVGDSAALAEGEGELTATNSSSEKRNPKDFALWKCSKPGEPAWESPWGKGRPGWHIECSVMACAILGEEIDIHSGGIDLKFPHHDNELAQAEAYYDTGKDWIKFFLHSGHLHIDGLKMSKSLKNFITIREALNQYTKRQIRLAFLLHPWKGTLNYSQDTMKDAISLEKYIFEFFLNVKDKLRSSTSTESVKWTGKEVTLYQMLAETQDSVDKSLRDNLDTKGALEALKDLILNINVYIRLSNPNEKSLEDIAKYIKKILKIFGVVDDSTIECNFERFNLTSTSNTEEVVMPFLRVLSDFRSEVKAAGIATKNKDILTACDKLRDEILPDLGVRLEDSESGKTVVKMVDRETLNREREAEKVRKEEKEREKEKRKKEQEEKEAKNRLPPTDWAKVEFTGKFSKYDDKNLPTHDMDGKELSKGQRKKIEKMFQEQEKRYQKTLESMSNGQ